MRWLFKEDPDSYSYEDLVKDGKTSWEGVRNNLALKNLRQVKKGDEILFYETGDQKSVVGIMRAESNAFAKDKVTDISKSKEISVNIRPLSKLKRPITLAEIKSKAEFKDFALVRISRLSVMPVTEEQWKEIVSMSGNATGF